MRPERKQHTRYSRHITRGPRWKALRMQALERDGWACVRCGVHTGLECDHVEPVRTHPHLAFTLSNLQILCGRCHAQKTRQELGHEPLSAERQEWRNLLHGVRGATTEQKVNRKC
ncbi:HNH endonuclease [Qipengyuania sp. 483]